MAHDWIYSRWNGDQNVPDFDVSWVLRALADDYVYHGDAEAALRYLLNNGFKTVSGRQILGLRDARSVLRRRRLELLRTYSLSNLFETAEQEVEVILGLEYEALKGMAADDPILLTNQFALDHLPTDVAGRLVSLRRFRFVSVSARSRFEALLAQITEQILTSVIKLNHMDGSNVQVRRQELVAVLNALAGLLRSENPSEIEVSRFFGEYGTYFAVKEASLSALVEHLRSRVQVAASLLLSMDHPAREGLEALLRSIQEDLDIEWLLVDLGRSLAAVDGGISNESPLVYTFEGVSSIALDQALDLLTEIDDLSRLENYLGGVRMPSDLAEMDMELLRQLVGDEVAWSLQQLQAIHAMLLEGGFSDAKDGRLILTPKAQRLIARQTLGDAFSNVALGRQGDHQTNSLGRGTSLAAESKPYSDGDLRLNVVETVLNAVKRNGGAPPVCVSPADFVSLETESTGAAATVLAMDLSLSMPMRDNFLSAKKVGVALAEFCRSRFPRDSFSMVGFSETARLIPVRELPELSWDFVYGTNLQAALLLSRYVLRKKVGTRSIIVVTDGEPTAHTQADGEAFFSYPPARETVDATLLEAMRCHRDGIRMTLVLVDTGVHALEFAERFVNASHGRLVVSTAETLLSTVVGDFSRWRETQKSVY